MSRQSVARLSAVIAVIGLWILPSHAQVPSARVPAEVETLQQAVSAEPQNLAAAYLGNHHRLELLARLGPGASGANLLFGGARVTSANAEQFRREFQQREDVYAAEIRRRGVPKVGGSYRMDLSQPCPGESPDPVFVELLQDDFKVRVRRSGAVAGDLVTGVATAATLTLGAGDYDPNTYSFGVIGNDGRIPLRTFGGVGCTMVLTRRASTPQFPMDQYAPHGVPLPRSFPPFQ
jgi:hypothetical protein